MGELLIFPTVEKEPLEPISELICAKPELYARLIGSQATQALELPDNIILGSE